MRTHSDIVASAGPDGALAAQLGTRRHQVRDWRLRDSVPPEWWPTFERLQVASVAELVAYIEAKRLVHGDQLTEVA